MDEEDPVSRAAEKAADVAGGGEGGRTRSQGPGQGGRRGRQGERQADAAVARLYMALG